MHASYSRSQLSPMKFLVQLQAYPLTRSMQIPPFWHGCDRHSSTSIWQFFPAKASLFIRHKILGILKKTDINMKIIKNSSHYSKL